MCNIPLLVKAISKSVHDMWGRHGKLINFQAKSVGMAKNKQNNNWHEDGCGFFLFLPKLKLASCQRGTSSLACFCHWVLKFDNRIEWCSKWSIICLKCINSHISLSSSKVKSQGTGSRPQYLWVWLGIRFKCCLFIFGIIWFAKKMKKRDLCLV